MGWRFWSSGRRKQPDLRLGVAWSESGCSAVLSKSETVQAVFQCEAEVTQAEQQLGTWVREQQLAGVTTEWVLPAHACQLHLVEAPQVADTELSDALGFRMADILGASADDLLVQGVRLPDDAYRGRTRMAYALCASRQTVAHLSGLARSLQLELHSLQPRELVLLRLFDDIQPDGAIAVLDVQRRDSALSLYREGALYLSRPVAMGWELLQGALDIAAEADLAEAQPDGLQLQARDHDDPRSPTAVLETLALELQRSFDYFDSQLGLGVISQLWLHLNQSQACEDLREVMASGLELRLNTQIRHLSVVPWLPETLTADPCHGLAHAFAASLRPPDHLDDPALSGSER